MGSVVMHRTWHERRDWALVTAMAGAGVALAFTLLVQPERLSSPSANVRSLAAGGAKFADRIPGAALPMPPRPVISIVSWPMARPASLDDDDTAWTMAAPRLPAASLPAVEGRTAKAVAPPRRGPVAMPPVRPAGLPLTVAAVEPRPSADPATTVLAPGPWLRVTGAVGAATQAVVDTGGSALSATGGLLARLLP